MRVVNNSKYVVGISGCVSYILHLSEQLRRVARWKPFLTKESIQEAWQICKNIHQDSQKVAKTCIWADKTKVEQHHLKKTPSSQ